MTKYMIVEFADGIQMVPSIWVQEDGICFWPNYTNQIKINNAIAKLEVPCTSTWSKQTVLRTFGKAKTHADGMMKLKLAEQLSDVDTAASDVERLSGKRSRHVRAKRYISSDDDDPGTNPPPPKKKLQPFPTVPKDFGSSILKATQRPAEQGNEGHFIESSEDERIQATSTPAEDTLVTDRDDHGHFVDTFENEWSTSIASSASEQGKHTTGLNEPFRRVSKSYNSEIVLGARTTPSTSKTPLCSNILARPQYPTSNESQAAPMESFHNKKSNAIDDGPEKQWPLKDILNKILTKLSRINYRLRDIEQNLDNKNNTEDADEDCDGGAEHSFPLQDQKALQKFENALEDKTYLTKMAQCMKTIGGSASNTVIVNVLRYVLSDKLALDYSWSGARKKKPFRDLNICRMLIKTVRSVTNTVTDDDIRAVVSKWLVQATLRNTRSTEKAERRNSTGNTVSKEKDASDK